MQPPTVRTLPETSNGGLPFVPFEDQLPGTCSDYFAIDGWVRYGSPGRRAGSGSHATPHWSPSETTRFWHKIHAAGTPGRILAMVFNNVWFTNFVADSHGAMEFQFDLAWQPTDAKNPSVDPADQADTLVSEPQVVINPDLPADSILSRETRSHPFPVCSPDRVKVRRLGGEGMRGCSN